MPPCLAPCTLHLQEAVGALAGAYKGVAGGQKEALQALLLRSVVSGRDAARLCAVQWSAKLFPFYDMAARWGPAAGRAGGRLAAVCRPGGGGDTVVQHTVLTCLCEDMSAVVVSSNARLC